MSSGEAIIGSTADGIITSWNHAAERLFGYAEKEIVEQPFSRLVPAKTSGDLTGSCRISGRVTASSGAICG